MYWFEAERLDVVCPRCGLFEFHVESGRMTPKNMPIVKVPNTWKKCNHYSVAVQDMMVQVRQKDSYDSTPHRAYVSGNNAVLHCSLCGVVGHNISTGQQFKVQKEFDMNPIIVIDE